MNFGLLNVFFKHFHDLISDVIVLELLRCLLVDFLKELDDLIVFRHGMLNNEHVVHRVISVNILVLRVALGIFRFLFQCGSPPLVIDSPHESLQVVILGRIMEVFCSEFGVILILLLQ